MFQLGQSAAIYCRVSTGDRTCARQEQDLRAFAKSQDQAHSLANQRSLKVAALAFRNLEWPFSDKEHLAEAFHWSADHLCPRLWLAFAFEIECDRCADEILQGRVIDLFAFADIDGASGIAFETGVEEA